MSVSYNIKFTPTVGSSATLIEYRDSSASQWIIPSEPANPTTASQYPLELERGKSYYVSVSAVSSKCAKRRAIISVQVPDGPAQPCCPAGYILSPDKTFCYKEEVTDPEIISSGSCLVASRENGAYSPSGAWLYDPGYTKHLPITNTHTLLPGVMWKGNPAGHAGDPNESAMNRDSVWVDTDCDGNKDPLAKCSVLQFTYLLDLPAPRRVYVGIGGDNTFRMDVNNQIIAQCESGPDGYLPGGNGGPCATAPPAASSATSNANFNIWHILPLDLAAGPNYITFSGTGDGSVNDAFAAVIYNNTADQIIAATSDADLDILFRTGDYRGQRVDIATCPDGWQLDTSGGVGHYVCRRITQTPIVQC